MSNPYRDKPDTSFWKKSVARLTAQEVDPVYKPKFRLGAEDRIATAGSCFAQHIAKTLIAKNFNYLVTEAQPGSIEASNESWGIFSARYGNVYTARQLLQLFYRAYAVFEPVARAFTNNRGHLVDPFRPYIQEQGFRSLAGLEADRAAHLSAVRLLFESCDVFIFTLGLTEAWIDTRDGAVFPVAPGVVSNEAGTETYRFHNFSAFEVKTDLEQFVDCLRSVNPKARILLTVSPVPLIATFDDRHVLTATVYSKSALRVAAEEVTLAHRHIDYFPSFEMITGPHSRGAFLEADLREVRPEGVTYVMNAFGRHYLTDATNGSIALAQETEHSRPLDRTQLDQQRAVLRQLSSVICDEEQIEQSL